jgi:hypothetical protein
MRKMNDNVHKSVSKRYKCNGLLIHRSKVQILIGAVHVVGQWIVVCQPMQLNPAASLKSRLGLFLYLQGREGGVL